MRVFHREFGSRYESYEFGYSTYASLETGDSLQDVYAAGFLPHSADPEVRDLFYMARSVRVPLRDWKITSENRRVLKKFDGFSTTLLTKEQLHSDPHFLPCFLNYFREHHGERVMSEERARGILGTPHALRGIRYEKDGEVSGYVLEIADEGFSHYWFSCYASHYAGTSFGMWLMLDAVGRAKAEGKDSIYLGTAYGSKGRYKTNFEPLQFWDGSEWKQDTKALKELTRLSSND
jgi:arginyl-tRNA--protein-N-Asp/Glu arginylyltransferase